MIWAVVFLYLHAPKAKHPAIQMVSRTRSCLYAENPGLMNRCRAMSLQHLKRAIALVLGLIVSAVIFPVASQFFSCQSFGVVKLRRCFGGHFRLRPFHKRHTLDTLSTGDVLDHLGHLCENVAPTQRHNLAIFCFYQPRMDHHQQVSLLHEPDPAFFAPNIWSTCPHCTR